MHFPISNNYFLSHSNRIFRYVKNYPDVQPSDWLTLHQRMLCIGTYILDSAEFKNYFHFLGQIRSLPYPIPFSIADFHGKLRFPAAVVRTVVAANKPDPFDPLVCSKRTLLAGLSTGSSQVRQRCAGKTAIMEAKFRTVKNYVC